MNSGSASAFEAGNRFGFRFKIGLALLVVNIPLGLGGGVLAAAAGAALGRPAFGIGLGVAIYVFSWILFAVGAILAGPEGVRRSRQTIRRWFSTGTGTKPSTRAKD